MSELEKALADIGRIRQQASAVALFQGFGPGVIAMTGLFALMTGAVQVFGGREPIDAGIFTLTWVATAMASIGIIGVEMIARSRRHHGGLADAMLLNAAKAFLPAGFAGAVIGTIVLLRMPAEAWLLPPLWQILTGLGAFAAMRNLPRQVAWVGLWYVGSGAIVLWLAAGTRVLDPWHMAVPFACGQFLMAAILWQAEGSVHDKI